MITFILFKSVGRMTPLPELRKCKFQGILLGLKITRLVALAYTLTSYVEAKSECATRIAGDVLDSSGIIG